MKEKLQIIPFREEFLGEAAALFIASYEAQRQAVPVLPPDLEDAHAVAKLIAELMQVSPGLAAVENGRLQGYMGWWLIDGFRNTPRKGAYCPEWAHAADPQALDYIYKALYREAASLWHAAGCQVHALTLLANDKAAERFWFWNGFGMIVVDAIRSIQPVGAPAPERLEIRRAEIEDAEAIAALEIEHWQHYLQPPTLMAPQTPEDAASYRIFLSDPHNSVWLALDEGEAVSYMRFEWRSFGAAEIVRSDTTTAITAAFTRPGYRGRGAAPAMLEAALQNYRELGYERCSVDFESINPEARIFWQKYFQTVCISVNRHPEV
jgi:GNAT superfamily N-acetyltransferase